jgi:hypothetical protein
MMRHFALVLAAALPMEGCAGCPVPAIDATAVGGELPASELLGWDTPRPGSGTTEDQAVPVLRRER